MDINTVPQYVNPVPLSTPPAKPTTYGRVKERVSSIPVHAWIAYVLIILTFLYAYRGNSKTISSLSSLNITGSGPAFIVESGNVGIGTTAPTAKLDVAGSIDASSLFTNNGPISGGTAGHHFLRTSAGAPRFVVGLTNSAADYTVSRYNDSNVFVDSPFSIIRSSGNVGIGTSSTVAKLHVRDDTSGAYAALIDQNHLNGYGLNIDVEATTGVNDALRIRNGSGNPIFSVKPAGLVGIGTATPAYPLHVATNVDAPPKNISGNDILTSYPYLNSSLNSLTTTGAALIAIGANNGYIYAYYGYISSSDERIKKDIQIIEDDDALQKLRSIEPKTYKYVDDIVRGSEKVYGFIAQEVKEVFPHAVKTVSEFIPNVYQRCLVNIDSQTISIPGKAQSGHLRIMTTAGVMEVDVSQIDSDTVQLPPDSLTQDNLKDGQVFVYGYKVDDFQNLNKEYLFTINFAATQELDRQVQQLRSENSSLLNTVNNLQSRLATLENLVSQLTNSN
jgi:hypothetical protein